MSKNILVLHGMYQSGDIFRYNCSNLRYILKNYATLHFMTATIPYKNDYSDVIDLYGWWENDDDYTGSEQSIQQIQKAFDDYGPFDGVIGFSQGAMINTILCALKNNNQENYKWFSPKFIINICGGDIDCSKYNHLFSDPIDIPSLHIVGEYDQLKDSSIDLSTAFKNPTVKIYQSDHEIPNQNNFYKDIVEFISLHDHFDTPSNYDIDIEHIDDQLDKDFFYRL